MTIRESRILAEILGTMERSAELSSDPDSGRREAWALVARVLSALADRVRVIEVAERTRLAAVERVVTAARRVDAATLAYERAVTDRETRDACHEQRLALSRLRVALAATEVPRAE